MSKATEARLTFEPSTRRIGSPSSSVAILQDSSLLGGCSLPRGDMDEFGERLVACWNACQGIPTEALNAGLIPHLMVMGTDADQMVRELSGTYIGDRIPGEIPGGYDQWNRFSDAAEAAAKILKAHPTK